jgi:ribose transport system ATP-binding protein
VSAALAARRISKSFGAVRALDRVGIEVDAGEVHGLLGENGSGKSTLIRVLAGYHEPEEGGELELRGRRVGLPLRPGQYRELGMSFVHQELGLIPSLTVLENLRLGELSTERRLWIAWRNERGRARETLSRFGVDLDPAARVEELRPVERAQLAVVRAVAGLPDGGGGLLVLDEPTAFLPEPERRRLFELARQVASEGAGVLLVSHDLDEVRAATDRVTVLRDGRNVGTVRTASVSGEELLELIVGRPLAPSGIGRETRPRKGGLSIEGLSGDVVREVSLDLDRGEILGLSGLAGSGFEEVPYLLFGALSARSGLMTLDGTELDLTAITPDRALRVGLALLPADRQRQGSVGSLSLADNLTLPALHRYTRRRRLDRRRMVEDASSLLVRHDVRPTRPGLAYGALSGGNQQKALFAKWLHTRPAFLLLDEPTRGVDVGARQQLMAAIREVAADGVSVLCASGDYEQLSLLCDRVLVFSGGRVTRQLTGELTQERIARECHARALEPRSAQ